jgi:hypothetical protein
MTSGSGDSRMIAAQDGEGRPLFACVSEGREEPQVGDTRILAYLRPFPNEETALAALNAAGAQPNKSGGRK